YFDNVGGSVLSAVLRLVNQGARIPICGMISQYNATTTAPGPNLGQLLVRRVRMEGFNVNDYLNRCDDFVSECGAWVRKGELRYREHIVDGLEAAPRAFIGLFDGENVGKLLVRVSPVANQRTSRRLGTRPPAASAMAPEVQGS